LPQTVISQGTVHYEVAGSGPPVILIHGWTQAWNTWRSTIETFEGQYRMYAPDLWGFGESDKDKRESFNVGDFVELIPQFMDQLGIGKVPIMGHSMGGTTALGVALKYPERVRKVAVVGSPVDGRSLSIFLKLAAQRFIARLMLAGDNTPMLRTFIRLWSPFVSRQNPDLFYNMTMENAAGFSLDSFFGSIRSLWHTDLRQAVRQMSVPAIGIYGQRDVIVMPNQAKYFENGYIPTARAIRVKNAGHFVMWDTPKQFNQVFQWFMDM
jgi:pimeloyl-ACP methyl ester carboxylesterase